LSWGNKFDTKKTLLTKARANELIIFMQSATTLSNELELAGAEVHYYGTSGFTPSSRFTIIGAGKNGSRVAVGSERKGRHIVYEYDTGEHPITALSDDFIRLLRLVS
jgi:hypothetical protein